MNLSFAKSPGSRRVGGFTLIELMVTVAIVAILVAIAVPAYNDQARRTRRANTKAAMMTLVQGLERWHTVNATYAGFPTATVRVPTSGQASYNIVPSGLSATGYTLTATAVNDQVHDSCGNITLTQTGTPTFSGGTVANCWTK